MNKHQTCIMAPVLILLLLHCVAISSSLETFVPTPSGHNSLHLRRCYFQTQLQIVLQSLLRYDYSLYYGGHVPTLNSREKGSFVLPVTSISPYSVTKLRAEHNELYKIGTAIRLHLIMFQLTGANSHIK